MQVLLPFITGLLTLYLSNKKSNHDYIKEENDRLNTECKRLQEENDRLNTECKRLQEENDRLRKNYEELRKDLIKYEAQH